MNKKLFITFEGIDGSGKDTQLLNLIDEIKTDNNNLFGDKYSTIWVTREPTKLTEPGKTICKLIKGESVSKEDATKYYIEDRKEHTKIIKEMINHSFVLSSRYDLSTLSYQMTQGMSFDELYKLHMYNKENGCLIPDLTIVFDIDAETSLKRVTKRSSDDLECFEKLDFQKKIVDNLKYCINELKKRDGRKIIVVNANQSIEKVKEEMINKIKNENL